jgi:hypothetical protein
MRTALVAALLLAIAGVPARAQSLAEQGRSVAIDALKDPTTYAPAIATEIGKTLDWSSSQRFFAAGYVEDNQFYTLSGLPHDRPVSRSTGHRINLEVSLHVLATSYANNVAAGMAERALSARWPHRKRLFHIVGIAERVGFAFLTGWMNSAGNFRQWRTNVNTTCLTTAGR